MSTSVSSVTSHFPGAQNGFTTTTASSVASGATTVTLNSVAGYTNGQPATLVIDPTDVSKKQTFTGIVDTSGIQLTSVVWTAGTNQTHALGATVVDYATATHIDMISKGILVGHTQKGNHKTLTDDNANEWIGQTSAASAVNYPDLSNSATGNGVVLAAKGDDTDIDLILTPKGTGTVKTSPVNKLDWSALPLGSVVQVVSTNLAAVATGTTLIPFDDTVPQISEGTEFITQSITPKSATNRLSIEVILYAAYSVVGEVIGALFQDSTASALAANSATVAGNSFLVQIKLTYDMAAGTTSATTFRIRAGGSTAGTITVNGTASARKFGGVTTSNIKVTEYKA